MKTFRRIMMMVAAICAVCVFSSCEEKVESTYYMTPQNWSTNATANLFIQALVTNAITTDGTTTTYFGTESSAISWFNSICDEMETAAFVDGIPVLDDSTVEMVLMTYGSVEAATRTVTFYVD